MKEIFHYIKKNKIILIVLFISLIGGGYFMLHQKTTPSPDQIKTEDLVEKKAPEKSNKETKKNSKTLGEKLVVDVQGAVKKPGVYRVKDKAIVQEVLQIAGGVTQNADLKQLNQAKRVSDQMQIYVPTKGEKSINNSTATNDQKKIVNINTDNPDDFKDVTGIGSKKAEKIIAYRQEHGDFKNLHDLTGVSGIGEKSLDKLKEQLTV